MNLNYKSYWRKTGLKGKWGNIFLERLSKRNPKNVLEIGVFCGVTARNTCDLLSKINGNNFNYIGVDLFGEDQNEYKDEIGGFVNEGYWSNEIDDSVKNGANAWIFWMDYGLNNGVDMGRAGYVRAVRDLK